MFPFSFCFLFETFSLARGKQPLRRVMRADTGVGGIELDRVHMVMRGVGVGGRGYNEKG
jgi:hypothetical protein